MKLYEIFLRAKSGLSHKHVGSLHSSDAHMALQNARDLYTRREEGESIWVVESANIISSNPQDKNAYFAPAQDKIYRHPSFYKIDKEVKNI
ncbi:1,2-phenylacetyl-CoA epoxidase, subunit B [hydrothermal vent metagenome]|uniref:1,2-phenylacetyl-CoA epoxidase, subunit B n=1 Tax=hydrothermal vent metagenome TaxID=652676 RepID=A0A3B0VZ18_9ZZZZ